MQHFKSWTIKDKYSEKPLQDIECVSDRANSLWSRNLKNIVIEDGAINIMGALDTLEALDYHFTNYIKLKDSKNDVCNKHEVAAYLNRIGQLYYFIISDFTKKYVPNSLELMSKVNELKIFRMKNTAHRSIDAPKGEPAYYKNRQAIVLLGFSSYLIIEGNNTQYLLPTHSESGETKWNCFTPEIDHKIVMNESYQLMELIIINIT